MWLRSSCEIEYNLSVETPMILMLRPRSGAQQWVAAEQYTFSSGTQPVEFTDSFGNLCQRVVAGPGNFCIHTAADVLAADACDVPPSAPFIEIQNLPDAVLPFLLPSRYAESDRFTEMARDLTQNLVPGYDQVAAIVDYIRSNIQYVPGSGGGPSSAAEINQRSQAVCSEMAHLGLALTRAISIPARMVVGYLHNLEPMDMHAWFEAYVGGRWYTFDPTQNDLSGARIAVGYGRDGADVALATQFGPAEAPIRMEVRVEEIEEAAVAAG